MSKCLLSTLSPYSNLTDHLCHPPRPLPPTTRKEPQSNMRAMPQLPPGFMSPLLSHAILSPTRRGSSSPHAAWPPGSRPRRRAWRHPPYPSICAAPLSPPSSSVRDEEACEEHDGDSEGESIEGKEPTQVEVALRHAPTPHFPILISVSC